MNTYTKPISQTDECLHAPVFPDCTSFNPYSYTPDNHALKELCEALLHMMDEQGVSTSYDNGLKYIKKIKQGEYFTLEELVEIFKPSPLILHDDHTGIILHSVKNQVSLSKYGWSIKACKTCQAVSIISQFKNKPFKIVLSVKGSNHA